MRRYEGWKELVPASWKCSECMTFAIGLNAKSVIDLGWGIVKRKDQSGVLVLCPDCIDDVA